VGGCGRVPGAWTGAGGAGKVATGTAGEGRRRLVVDLMMVVVMDRRRVRHRRPPAVGTGFSGTAAGFASSFTFKKAETAQVPSGIGSER
jgi:hypothetical protein